MLAESFEMKIRIKELRRIIRGVLSEKGWGPGVTADPTETPSTDGFYPYDLERGVDILGKWYKSPGELTGDPGRPEDAAEYIGMTVKTGGGGGEGGGGDVF